MPSSQYTDYGPFVAALLNGVPPASLDAGVPNEKFRAALVALTLENLFVSTGKPIRDARMARCCLAGLWLRHNFFDESHALSQEIETPTGSFWHAILHRREPDYGNARYWFRRAGQHPILPALAQAAFAAGWPSSPPWNPSSLIDRVERTSGKNTAAADLELCRAIQQVEWELLFDYSWRQALGLS